MTHYLVRAIERREARKLQEKEAASSPALFSTDTWTDDDNEDAFNGRTFQWWTTRGSSLG